MALQGAARLALSIGMQRESSHFAAWMVRCRNIAGGTGRSIGATLHNYGGTLTVPSRGKRILQ